MPESVFWDLNPKRLEAWQRTYVYQEQLRRDEQDYEAWLHGQYVIAALGSILDGKKCPYPSEPYSITARKEEQAEANRQAADAFRAYALAYNKKYGLG